VALGGGQRALVIDDEGPIREALEDMLLDEGYEVRTAADGLRGLEVLRDWRPDVILLDMSMPVMGGRAFREAQQGLPEELRRVPVIALTGARNADEQALEIGAAAVLPKPFDLDELEATVDRVLEAGADGSRIPSRGQ
jgi:CheY-like chemotaxis protein